MEKNDKYPIGQQDFKTLRERTKCLANISCLMIALTLNATNATNEEEDDAFMIQMMLMSPMDDALTKSVKSDDFIRPYAKFLFKQDIFFHLPKGFSLADSAYRHPYLFIPNKHHVSKYYTTNGMSTYTPPFYSKEKDAMILFPLKLASVSSDFLIEDEMMAAYDDVNIDCTDKVMCLQDEDMKRRSNIDRLYFYEYDFNSDENPDYRHCVGLVLRKENHVSFPMKLLLTDDGMKNKEKYIKIALECVIYGDVPQQLWEEEEKGLKKNRKEGTFPLKRISNTGIIIERPSNVNTSNPVEHIKSFLKY